jgi:hypothetical protein
MPADLSPERIGIVFVRLDDLPAVPALDGATSQLRTAVDSRPIYGTKEFPVAEAAHAQCCFVLRPNQTQ